MNRLNVLEVWQLLDILCNPAWCSLESIQRKLKLRDESSLEYDREIGFEVLKGPGGGKSIKNLGSFPMWNGSLVNPEIRQGAVVCTRVEPWSLTRRLHVSINRIAVACVDLGLFVLSVPCRPCSKSVQIFVTTIV